MEQNQSGLYEKLPEQRRVYTSAQKLLLLITLLMGAVFAFVFIEFEGSLNAFALPYALFWGIYLAGYYYLLPGARKNKAAWALIAVVALLFLRYAVYQEKTLSLLNYLAIPLLLMLHAVVGSFSAAPGCEGEYAIQYFMGFFIKPFSQMGRFFGAAGSLFQKRDGVKRGGVLLGLIIGLPLALFVLSLLMRADSVLSFYAESLFESLSLSTLLWKLALMALVALLFYSFLFATAWGGTPSRTEPYQKKLEPATLHTVLFLLLTVYALFGCVQFFYLTGLRGLPEGLTYSQYAVRGFNELLVVALINLGIFSLCLRFEKENKLKRPLLIALLLATILVLLSGAARLLMYIDAYALTISRVLSLWFILFLFVAVVLCFVRLFREKTKLMRAVVAAFIALYLLLNALNLDAIIAQSVLVRAEARGTLGEGDANFLRYELSSDAEGVLKASRLRDDIYYDVEP